MADTNMHRRSPCLILAVLIFWSGLVSPPSVAVGEASRPFTLSPLRETVFFTAAGVLGLTGEYAVSRVHAPDPATLRKSEVPGFDRIALNFHSSSAGRWSNITVGACAVLPF
ncbi:MAG TPA: hypothetical protein VHR86_06120, partial [Armatimonadota bacterium]|nr:hypothetical protein [Armatimonadota bacterium]